MYVKEDGERVRNLVIFLPSSSIQVFSAFHCLWLGYVSTVKRENLQKPGSNATNPWTEKCKHLSRRGSIGIPLPLWKKSALHLLKQISFGIPNGLQMYLYPTLNQLQHFPGSPIS